MLGINTRREPVKGDFAKRILEMVRKMIEGKGIEEARESKQSRYSVIWE